MSQGSARKRAAFLLLRKITEVDTISGARGGSPHPGLPYLFGFREGEFDAVAQRVDAVGADAHAIAEAP